MEDIQTLHHGVPRSMDGANGQNLNGGNGNDVPAHLLRTLSDTNVKDCNLTLLPEAEHNAYHMIFGRKVPHFHLRMMLLCGIGDRENQYLPPDEVNELLSLLLNEDWREPYLSEAFRSVGDTVNGNELSRHRLARTAIHLRHDVDIERLASGQALECAAQNKFLPFAPSRYIDDARGFFSRHVDGILSLRDCMKHMLLDRTEGNGDLKWVKPMRPSYRSAILDILRDANPVDISNPQMRERYVPVIINHMQALDRYPRSWEPCVHNYRNEIAELVMYTSPSQSDEGFPA